MNMINVIESQPLNRGNRVVVGVVDAATLVDRSSVDTRDWQEQSGYQRQANSNRIIKISRLLKDNSVDLASSFLVGIRAPASEVLLSKGKGGLCLDLNGHKAHIIDAQHRVGALKKILDGNEGDYDGHLVNVNFILDSNEIVEMEVFHSTNSTAEKMRPDLSYDLMKQRYDKDPTYRKVVKRERKEWIIKGQKLVERLAKDSPHWQGRIRFPHEPTADTTIGNSGLVNSLEKLLTSETFTGQYTEAQQFSILKCFWASVARALPECLLPGEARNYTLQKAVGAQTMHTLLASLIERGTQTSSGIILGAYSLFDPAAYDCVQGALKNLTGENQLGGQVTGAQFWRVGAAGVASFHASTNLARRVLVDKMKAGMGDWEGDTP